ncbi:hypothetical protein evm_011134 [Chilo suppressalis]|nr:hypothetical protein evm_011134 [Chilo suppressalis]
MGEDTTRTAIVLMETWIVILSITRILTHNMRNSTDIPVGGSWGGETEDNADLVKKTVAGGQHACAAVGPNVCPNVLPE